MKFPLQRVPHGPSIDTAEVSALESQVWRPTFIPGQVPLQARWEGESRRNRLLASLPGVVQRVSETETDYKSGGALKGMTLSGFDTYAQTQADWFASETIESSDRDALRKVLGFAREPNILRACGGITVSEFIDLDDLALGHLRVFAKFLVDGDPIHLGQPVEAYGGIVIGRELPKLIDAFSKPVIARAMNERALLNITGGNGFGQTNYTDDVIAYVKNAHLKPYFEAQGGTDFLSYYEMRKTDVKNPLDYDATKLKGKVRNYHRFEKAALDRLVVNYNDTSKAKPLTLILHSAVDHNGAFHRAKGLTKVITNGSILTLMVEGGETLASYKAQAGVIVEEYGIGGHFDQVLMSGHGGMRSVEMAGTPEAKESVDLDKNKDASEDLIGWIMDHMDPGLALDGFEANSRRRIVYNACLTNTNYMPYGDVPDTENIDEINKAIRDYLADHPTLKAYTDSVSTDKTGGAVTAEGANAVTRASGLIDDDSGRLRLSSEDDPHLTASKLEYLEKGVEPIGVLRAAVECMSSEAEITRTTALLKMQQRAQGPTDDWRKAFIAASFDMVLKLAPKNQAWVLSGLSVGSGQLENLLQPGSKLSNAGFLMALGEGAVPFLAKLKGSNIWGDLVFRLKMLQVWMKIEPGKVAHRTEFLTSAKQRVCDSLRPLIDIPFLVKHNLMENLLAAGDAGGRLRLALLGVMAAEVENHSKAYLLRLLHEKETFDVGLDVPGVLGGVGSVALVQQRVGKPLPGLDLPVEVEKAGNVKFAGDDTNKGWVRSVTKAGQISKSPSATVYTKPSSESATLITLDETTPVKIFGELSEWYGIERFTEEVGAITYYVDGFYLKSQDPGGTQTISQGDTDAYPSLVDLKEMENEVSLEPETAVTVVESGLGKKGDICKITVAGGTIRRFSSGFVKKTDVTVP